MENQNTNFSDITPHSEKKHFKKTHLLLIVILILITFVSTTAYLWQKEKSNNAKLTAQLNSQTSNKQPVKDASVDTVSAQSAQQEPKVEQKNTAYQAKVGKFTLSVPKSYGITVHHDGGGEGAASTKLAIGKIIGENVNFTEDYGYISLEAVDNSGGNVGPMSAFIKNSNVEIVNKLPAVTIGGIAAQAYETGGLSNGVSYFFEKNNIFYHVSTNNMSSPDAGKDLDVLVKGLKLN